MRKFFNILIVCMLCISVYSYAQTADTIIQVSFDNKGLVKELNSNLENKLVLFPEIQNFESARIFKYSANAYSLEIISSGKLVKRFLSKDDYELLRVKTDAKILASLNGETVAPALPPVMSSPLGLPIPPSSTEQLPVDDREPAIVGGDPQDFDGHSRLYAYSTIYSLYAMGFLASNIAINSKENTNGSALTGMILLGGSAGFLVPYLSLQDKKVTGGMAQLTGTGYVLGAINGGLLGGLLSNKTEGSASSAESNFRLISTMTALGGFAGGALGYGFAKNYNVTPAQAQLMGTNATFGLLSGFFLGTTFVGDNIVSVNSILASSILGNLGGLYVGRQIGLKEYYTRGDAEMYSVSSTTFFLTSNLFLGGLGLYNHIDDEASGRGLLLLQSGLSVGSLLFARAVTRDHDFNIKDARNTGLATFAGGLGGLGLGFIINSNGNNGQIVALTSSLGLATGYLLSYFKYDEKRSTETTRPKRAQLNMDFNPMGLMQNINKNMMTSYSSDPRDRYQPALTLSYKF